MLILHTVTFSSKIAFLDLSLCGKVQPLSLISVFSNPFLSTLTNTCSSVWTTVSFHLNLISEVSNMG